MYTIPTFKSETDIKDEDKELMKKFAETVKAHNLNVLEQSRDASKLQVVESDDSLADDFNATQFKIQDYMERASRGK